jgi:isopenicillin N synthase-like dioxygenase
MSARTVSTSTAGLPVIDVAPLVGRAGGRRDDCDHAERDAVARAIGEACRSSGFFYAVGHGVPDALQDRLLALAREFFAGEDERKLAIGMERGGRAWRGYFPVGGELTSGRPDRKEGIYFGAELARDDPRVVAGLPLHGANLFPDEPAGLRAAVLTYMDELTRLGHALVRGIAVSLGLDEGFFAARYTADPFVLFRIFHYPPADPLDGAGGPGAPGASVGVGEHTDYGLLTILRQDDSGGLEVHAPRGWIDVPPVPGSFVCNIGDMLDRMTGGRYRSTPHRVRSPRGRGRISLPYFFDPAFDAEIRPIEIDDGWAVPEDRAERWDRASLRDLHGTYGSYLLGKVARVFPELAAGALDGEGRPARG